MMRRDLLKASLATGAATLFSKSGGGIALAGQNPFSEPNGLTKYVAEFVLNTKYENIPSDVLALGKKSILDGFGLALAGSVAESGPISRKYIQSLGLCEGKSTVIGSALKSAPRFAAFVNGVSIHADDFDDTQLAVAKDRVYGLLTHPTAPVLPPTFAIAELGKVSGKDFLLAYHLGVEVETKLAEASSPRHYEDGFHSTGTFGTLGSATACAKIRGFSPEKILTTYGIAASEASGLRENFGTMTKPFHAGHAAENGVVAADLTSLGWTAAPQILEAPRGFFHAYSGTYDLSAIIDKLGNPWTFANPGVSLKPYPSGSLTHPAMTALLRLIRKYDIIATEVEKVDVGTNHNMPNALIHHHPQTGLQAKFSMEFCLSVLLLERRAVLGQFTDEYVRRPEVQEIIRRINFYVDPVAEKAGYDKMTSIITIHLRDGRTLKDQADFAKGSPADPMTFEETAAKFRGCAEYAKWPQSKTEKIIDFIMALESAPDMSAMSPLLSSEKE
ncbi:MAG TPA: MmgE/PrpD family protein [Candidatus Acidoferrum sp.]|jgi:2-methylcitrate dehydratase PrpD|nr:MmgE/PrpD family protein [Candidatus Acidoferrum sp.]